MSSSPFSLTPTQERAAPAQLLTRTKPFDTSLLADLPEFDADKVQYVEFGDNDELYGHIVNHIVECTPDVRSFKLGVGRGKGSGCDDDDDVEIIRTSQKTLGLGVFTFSSSKTSGRTLVALHSTIGEVVGTDCGPMILKTLILCADHIDHITALADALLAEADKTDSRKYTLYRWHVQHHYWQRDETAPARALESVVLPEAIKSKLVADLDDFVSAGTRKWYEQHGIPYKRSYLLYGSPGAGKTSLIQAIAGRYKRSLAYLQPSHPKMDDDGLKQAVQRVPPKSIIVLEDVDAVFDESRGKKESNKSSVTFSGFLNALDGVGRCTGQIFILTTNHRERLDPALIRCGRVDCHIEFTCAEREQTVGLFRQFYPDAKAALAEKFADELRRHLGESKVSMAQLQHFFIQMRKESAEVAAESSSKVIEEMAAHGDQVKEREAREAKDKEKAKEAAKKEEEDKGDNDEEEEQQQEEKTKKTKAKGEMHVHVHMH